MELIELHILQSFPVTCLNRDDVGAPKSAFFGGVQRARVSSQSWKRAIRELAADHASGQGTSNAFFAGKRGHFMAEKLERAIEAHAVAGPQAQEAAEAIATFLAKQDPKHREGHRTLVALYLSPNEVDAIAKAVAGDLNESGSVKVSKGSLKKVLSATAPKDTADIALFGRMVASDHSLMIEGAGLFSHALSTHAASNEVEFFSAVDETKEQEETDEGAGHIGTLEFNSACYYRYVGLNLGLLWDGGHLGHFSVPEQEAVLGTFLRSALLAVPGARKNSMFGFNPPAYVLGLKRRGQPLSLVNAFESPVKARGEGFVQPSVERLEQHLKKLREVYGLGADVEVRIPGSTLDELIGKLVGFDGHEGA